MVQDVRVDTGMEVYTRDHHRLGTVKEVRGGCFKVKARLARDYWLRSRNALFLDDGRIVMEFANSESRLFKDREPIAA
jgi:hypothetical protein